MSEYSLSDIAMASNGEGFGGNNGFFWVFALLLLANGGLGFGNRTGEFGQYATAASQQEILFGQQFQGLDNKIDRLGNGLADLGFSLNNSIKDGNTGVAGAVVGEGRALSDKLSECCCSIKEAVHAEGEATRGMIQQNKIESLQAQVNQLQFTQAINNATCGVVKYPTSSTYYAGANPFCPQIGCGNM